MRRDQHRRSFSVKPETYVRLKMCADEQGISPTALVERIANETLTALGIPQVSRAEAIAGKLLERKAKVALAEEIARQHFTF